LKRKGIASIVGTLFFALTFLAAVGTFMYIEGAQTQYNQAVQNAQATVDQHQRESLTYQAFPNGTLAIENTGTSSSQLVAAILKLANGSVFSFSQASSIGSNALEPVPALIPMNQNCGTSTCLSRYNYILGSSNSGDSIGIVTSLGNVFWLKPATAVQTGDQSATHQVTFDASGDGSFGSSNVIVVDGTGYTASQLPVTLTWFAGTQHSYAFQTLAEGTGTQVGISSVSGLETAASGKITATSTGTVRTTYTTQYLLTVNGGSGLAYSGSPVGGVGSCNGTSSCWYNSGTTVQVTTNNVWSVVAGQSRQNLASWNVDGGSNTNAVRSGTGTWTTNPITMTSPQTLNLNSVTQYYVTLQSSVPASGSVPALSTSYSYVGPTTNPQAAADPSFAGGALGPWTESATESGCTSPGVACADTITVNSGSVSVYTAAQSSGPLTYEGTATDEIQQTLQSPPGGATYTSMTFSMQVSMSEYYVYGPAGAALCIWISGGSQSCTTGSGTVTATWSGSTTAVPAIFVESSASALYYNGFGIAIVQASLTGASWSVTYTSPMSGTASSTSNAFSVSGATVTYSYGVGYSYPSGSTSMSWSAPWPTTEAYSSNTCSGVTSTSNPIAASPAAISAACTLTTTSSGSYSSSGASPTGDGWYDAGASASIAASGSGPFAFSSWTTSYSGQLLIASSASASTAVTVDTYGTVTANYNVSQ